MKEKKNWKTFSSSFVTRLFVFWIIDSFQTLSSPHHTIRMVRHMLIVSDVDSGFFSFCRTFGVRCIWSRRKSWKRQTIVKRFSFVCETFFFNFPAFISRWGEWENSPTFFLYSPLMFRGNVSEELSFFFRSSATSSSRHPNRFVCDCRVEDGKSAVFNTFKQSLEAVKCEKKCCKMMKNGREIFRSLSRRLSSVCRIIIFVIIIIITLRCIVSEFAMLRFVSFTAPSTLISHLNSFSKFKWGFFLFSLTFPLCWMPTRVDLDELSYAKFTSVLSLDNLQLLFGVVFTFVVFIGIYLVRFLDFLLSLLLE